MGQKADELVQECRRQSESCLYTSTAFFIWLRNLRFWRGFFVITPLVLGGLATGRLLFWASSETTTIISAVSAFLAGLFPSIYSALKFDDRLRECTNAAAEFKNLQDRFRQAAQVAAHKSFAEFEKQFNDLMNRLESARNPSITPPEKIFRAAQAKVKSGDYNFDVDIAADLAREEVSRSSPVSGPRRTLTQAPSEGSPTKDSVS